MNKYNQAEVEEIFQEVESEPIKNYWALKIIPLVLLVALTVFLSIPYVGIANDTSAGRGIGLALYLTIFVIVIGGAVSLVSLIVCSVGLAFTFKNIPKGKRAISVAIYVALMGAQIGIEVLFYLLCIL